MLIKFNSVIINGVDKTGKVEDIDDKQALTMINLGYAEPETIKAVPVENYVDPRHTGFVEPEDPRENTHKKKSSK
jgi:hypothetical protein